MAIYWIVYGGFMEIRVNIEDKFMRRLKDLLRVKTPEIARAALTILSWAAEDVKKGRVILSTDAEGKNIHRLAIPTLEAIRPHQETSEAIKQPPQPTDFVRTGTPHEAYPQAASAGAGTPYEAYPQAAPAGTSYPQGSPIAQAAAAPGAPSQVGVANIMTPEEAASVLQRIKAQGAAGS
jgi:hypothetical protein